MCYRLSFALSKGEVRILTHNISKCNLIWTPSYYVDKMKSFGGALIQGDWCHVDTGKSGHSHPHRENSMGRWEQRARQRFYRLKNAKACQKTTRSQGRGTGQILPLHSQERAPQLTPWSQNLRLQKSGTVSFCCLSHSFCGALLWQPWQTDISG